MYTRRKPKSDYRLSLARGAEDGLKFQPYQFAHLAGSDYKGWVNERDDEDGQRVTSRYGPACSHIHCKRIAVDAE